MDRTATTLQSQISTVRAFNRFYTARLGLLRSRYLESDYSLTESRLLFEISLQPDVTARELRDRLELDAGYISRLISSMVRNGLVVEKKSKTDGREKLLRLSSKGAKATQVLNQASEGEIAKILASIEERERETVAHALETVHRLLEQGQPVKRVVRASPEQKRTLLMLLEEYFAELGVVKRDTSADISRMLKDEDFGFWIAYEGTTPTGCIALRPLEGHPDAGECKRMYVRPEYRGQGLAASLLDALEGFAKQRGLKRIYLDTFGDLKAAISLYKKRGYQTCERYNSNPQATIFLRKQLDS